MMHKAVFVLLAAFLFTSAPSFAADSQWVHGRAKTVKVRSYKKKSGKTVKAHKRAKSRK
ncbi:MAG: hypothetical protein K1X64_10715 [Myxococcaceae bacterium]|nr:hypothetical protein [Myxococcaceae bacterium]